MTSRPLTAAIDADGSTSLAESVELYKRHHPSADDGAA